MTWQLLIAKIIEMFLPYLLDWIRDQLAHLKLDGSPDDLDAPAVVARVFDAAIARVPFWRFYRRWSLECCQRIAVRHAAEVVQSVRYGERAPLLAKWERDELKAL